MTAFSDAEWNAAHEHLVTEWIDRGCTRDEAESLVDDLTVLDQCQAARDDARADRAHQQWKDHR